MKRHQVKHRLLHGVVEKLAKNPGGGTHKSAKEYNRQRDKAQVRKRVSEYE
ncbi:MAG TPA: hypothetical protein VJJ02_01435 [Candidatus Paceibacterota bacterium]